jgi:sialate O-acetylesterase
MKPAMKSVLPLAALAVLFLPALPGQELRVTGGAADHQVFQRNSAGLADIPLNGAALIRKANGKFVELRLSSRTGPVAGFDWISFARIQRGNWSGTLHNVPTGGPYRIEIRLRDSPIVLTINDLLVGDLWILAGQSNMEGHGDLIDVQTPDPLVHTFDMADNWAVAQEPLHTTANAVDPIHWPLNASHLPERLTGDKLTAYLANRKKGAGLGLPFAVDMLKFTGIPIGLIPCAHGGTSMQEWSPALRDRGGQSLYGSMLRRFRAAGGHVKGVLWYQGESDANPHSAPNFETNFVAFVAALRNDFGDPNLPFYYVQIGRHISAANVASWNQIQQAQLQAEARIPHSGMVASVDLSLDDGIHISTPDLKRLGMRLARRACHDLYPALGGCGAFKPGPHPASAFSGGGVIAVSFYGVNGRLTAPGRIAGFSIHTPDGAEVPLIYKATIDPAEASTVRLHVQGKLPQGAALYYGYGKDPFCNLTDELDMAVPMFGPMPIRPAN